jgi:hypothetical protein
MASPPPRARRVGVELELGGLDASAAAAVVRDWLGGTVRHLTEAEQEIDTRLGTFRVELDSTPVKKLARLGGSGGVASLAAEVVARLAKEIVPCEIVTPPLEVRDLPRLDELVARLGAAGARGTYDALRFAFGLHFNPELLDPTAPRILAHLRAFSLLYRWLLDEGEVDTVRRVAVYIDPFPTDYVQLIMRDDYAPSLPALIDDYLTHNPTRNRALDMLPMFAHLDPDRVRARVDEPLIKPRPTFHYRLPNCRVGEPGWRVTDEWQRWIRVEALAAEPDELERARRTFRHATDPDALDTFKEVIGRT